MNLLDLPDDVQEDIARFLDAPAVAAFRAASHAAAISRLVLADRAHAAYFALCRDDAELFHAIMPRYLGKRRSKYASFKHRKAKALYSQVATCFVRGNVGPGLPWALLNGWSHDAGLMTEPKMAELTRLALNRGASRALVALLKYRGRDPIHLSWGYPDHATRLAAFFAHPRMHNDPLRTEIALHLSLPLVNCAYPIPSYAQTLMQCDTGLVLAYLSALDHGLTSLQLIACILERGVCTQGSEFALLDVLRDAFYLSSTSTSDTLELARARLELHVNGDSQLAQRLVVWMARVGASVVQNALLGILSISIMGHYLITPTYVRWAARYLAQDTALQASSVRHAVAQGLYALSRGPENTELAIAFLRGFPIDLMHTPMTDDGESQDCLACRVCIVDATSEFGPQWLVRAVPASDLELALARSTADAALHTILVENPNATHSTWIRVLQTRYLDCSKLFRAWGELCRSENQLLADAGIEPLESTCGLGGAGIHLATLVSAYMNRMQRESYNWRAKFVDAVATAREVWPEVVAGWRLDVQVAKHLLETISVNSLHLTGSHLHDMLAALAEAGIVVDVTPEEFFALI
ncbi:hypothetical protein BC828DRAFT_391211, partial [Blastocladiella britannica]